MSFRNLKQNFVLGFMAALLSIALLFTQAMGLTRSVEHGKLLSNLSAHSQTDRSFSECSKAESVEFFHSCVAFDGIALALYAQSHVLAFQALALQYLERDSQELLSIFKNTLREYNPRAPPTLF